MPGTQPVLDGPRSSPWQWCSCGQNRTSSISDPTRSCSWIDGAPSRLILSDLLGCGDSVRERSMNTWLAENVFIKDIKFYYPEPIDNILRLLFAFFNQAEGTGSPSRTGNLMLLFRFPDQGTSCQALTARKWLNLNTSSVSWGKSLW